MINALNIAQTMTNVPMICQVSCSWLMERSSIGSVMKVKDGAAPSLQSERPLPTAFQLPCPNPTAAYSRTYKTRHISRTAAVICITKLDHAANFLTKSIAGCLQFLTLIQCSAQGHKLNCK